MIKRNKSYLTLIALFVIGTNAIAQSCENPTTLCGGETAGVSEFYPIDFTGSPVEACLTGDVWSVVRFHTTHLSSDNGVNVSLQNVDCPNSTLMAIVVLPNQLDFCDILQYTPVSDCVTITSDLNFITDSGLLTNTDYLILFSHQTGGVSTQCEFSVTASGEPLSIVACCPITIDFGESAGLEVLGGDGGIGYQWEPAEYVDNPSAYQVVVSPPQTTTFTVSGFVESCEYSDQVIVTVGTDVVVPNSFSPNGDSMNDTWKITGLDAYPGSIVTLYDRWGQQVFRYVGSQEWDGRYSGKDAPIGTYYYVIELVHPSIYLEPLTGNVAIIR